MRIQKSCKPVDSVPPPPSKTINQVVPGTVFMYGNSPKHLSGPFVRTYGGAVNLTTHNQHIEGAFPGMLENYKELPNAFLVTGEEA